MSGAKNDSVSEREYRLIDVVALRGTVAYNHASIKRRSPREFDVEYSGPGYASWLPLAAICAVNWIKFAEMSSYPEMVREGDWSGIRDSTRDEIWEMFEVARRELEGETAKASGPTPGPLHTDGVNVQDGRGRTVAIAYDPDAMTQASPVALANAKLFAVAPNMLELLKIALRHFGGHQGGPGDAITGIEREQRLNTLDQIHDLVAKAEGRK